LRLQFFESLSFNNFLPVLRRSGIHFFLKRNPALNNSINLITSNGFEFSYF